MVLQLGGKPKILVGDLLQVERERVIVFASLFELVLGGPQRGLSVARSPSSPFRAVRRRCSTPVVSPEALMRPRPSLMAAVGSRMKVPRAVRSRFQRSRASEGSAPLGSSGDARSPPVARGPDRARRRAGHRSRRRSRLRAPLLVDRLRLCPRWRSWRSPPPAMPPGDVFKSEGANQWCRRSAKTAMGTSRSSMVSSSAKYSPASGPRDQVSLGVRSVWSRRGFRPTASRSRTSLGAAGLTRSIPSPTASTSTQIHPDPPDSPWATLLALCPSESGHFGSQQTEPEGPRSLPETQRCPLDAQFEVDRSVGCVCGQVGCRTNGWHLDRGVPFSSTHAFILRKASSPRSLRSSCQIAR